MKKLTVKMLIRSVGEHLTDMVGLIYPRICLSCERPLLGHEVNFCTFCTVSFPLTNFHLAPDNPVSRMFWGKAEIAGAASCFYFEKGGPVQHLVHRFKYKGFKEIGIDIGKKYGGELKEAVPFSTVDVIIPVPLHKSKLKDRGYNQSEYFATGLSQSMNIPTNFSALKRVVETETQTHKTKFERFTNVETIFALNNNHGLTGKHILVVDDVVTTGSTLEACCRVLHNAGNTVSVATMAYAK